MNLEQVVPPLELCKLIPKGEFENSALVWAEIKKENEVKSYIYTADMVNYYATSFHELYPAPTLQEILAELKGFEMIGNTKRYYVSKGYLTVTEKNMVDCALGLWFKYKGKI